MLSEQERLKDLLNYVQADYRVCPQPLKWAQLWEMLPDRRQDSGAWLPLVPMILSGWWVATDEEKAERFEYHIRWAYDRDALRSVDRFLRQLPANEWHYRPKSSWPSDALPADRHS